MNVLSANEIIQIEKNYSLKVNSKEIIPVSGGDVNQTYQIQTSENKYIVKKIDLKKHTKKYRASEEDIKKSICFAEDICQEQKRLGNVAPAVKGNSGIFLEVQHNLLILYPFVKGQIFENEKITNDMVTLISRRLYSLHHEKIAYDITFSRKKNSYITAGGQQIATHHLWHKLQPIVKHLPFFPRFKATFQFITENQEALLHSIQSMSVESVCHNDLKPKNVLWGGDKNYWIIDWEAACDFDHRVDYLDTLLAWCIEIHDNSFTINREKIAFFQEAYYLSVDELHSAMNIVILKWIFWFSFNLVNCIEHPGKLSQSTAQVRLALGFINLLIENLQLGFLGKH